MQDGLHNALHIPEESMSLKGVWVFQSSLTNGHKHDLRQKERVERVVHAIGDVAIVLAHPMEGEHRRMFLGERRSYLRCSWIIGLKRELYV